ncbi:MAG TPA: hypothetical protein VJL29_13840 [Thermoguttaceae bacterium]|nr:hypothetical protein [Thermoguttaceae bacterium]
MNAWDGSSAAGASPSGVERPRFDPNRADTSQAARHSAVASIPFDKLDAAARRKASSVLSRPTLFRRMPLHVAQCDPDLYRFLARHPDVLVSIWEELGISDFRMTENESGTFRAVEGNSTLGTAEFLYQDKDTYVVYCEGEYRGPLLAKPVRGRAILILKTGHVQEADGRYYITSRLDTFTYIEDATIDFLTRTFQPLVGKVVDNNFLQTSAFVGSLSRTAEVNPRGVQRLATRLNRVRPEVRREFAAVARQVEQRATRQVSLETPMPVGTPTTARADAGRY